MEGQEEAGISQKLEPRAEARAQSPADVQPAYTVGPAETGNLPTAHKFAIRLVRAATACPSAPERRIYAGTRNHPPRKRP